MTGEPDARDEELEPPPMGGQAEGSKDAPVLPSEALPPLDFPMTPASAAVPDGDSGARPTAGFAPDDDAAELGSDPRIVVPPLRGEGRLVGPNESGQRQAAVAPEAGDSFLGRSFGGYKLLETIGRGGMGSVYKGVQVSLDRTVAVKLLNKALVDNDEFIKRFQREARAMGNVVHPNIVSVIDFGEYEGVWFLVAEYVEGTNLARMIRDKLMVPAEELVPIMVQCCSGLAYVSKSNVVHRDIKPDNILIDRESTAKIADFGLAKDLASEDTDLTVAGSAMGTPAYMSPEQCMGRKLDVRSDLYSLGVTAYYALTGEKPFVGQSSFEIMTKQRELVPPSPIKLNPQVPQPISDLVMRMMAKQPTDRFRDAEECREAWLSVGTDLGVFGSVTRSGEFLFTAPPSQVGGNGGGAADQAPPTLSYPDEPPPPPPPDIPDLAALAQSIPPTTEAVAPASERRARRGSETQARRGSEAHPRPESRLGSGPHARPDLDERSGEGTARSARNVEGDSQRHVAPRGRGALTGADALREAERLCRMGRHRDAAALYARLADETQDRRQRAVLRAKEREARALDDEEHLQETRVRLDDLERRGEYRAAVQMLERNLAQSGTVAMSQRLHAELTRVRRRMSRRRLWIWWILILILGGALGGWFARSHLKEWWQALSAVGSSVVDSTEALGNGVPEDAADEVLP